MLNDKPILASLEVTIINVDHSLAAFLRVACVSLVRVEDLRRLSLSLEPLLLACVQHALINLDSAKSQACLAFL